MNEDQAQEYRSTPGSGFYSTSAPAAIAFLFFLVNIVAFVLYRRRRVYLGTDHLLVIDDDGYTENYRFISYRDIESIRLRRTVNYPMWGWVFGIYSVLILWLGYIATAEWAQIALSAVAAFTLILLMVHLLKGPTVSVRLETAVSVIELPNLDRLRRAEQVIATITEQIVEAQGTLDQSELGARLETVREREAEVVPDEDRTESEVNSAPGTAHLNDYGGRWHRIAYRLLFAEGLLTAFTLILNNVATMSAGLILFLSAGVSAIVAWRKQQSSRLPSAVQKLTVAVLWYLVFAVLVGWVESTMFMNQYSSQSDGVIQHLASLDPWEHTWYLVHCLSFGLASMVLAILGLVWLRRNPQPEAPRPPTLSAASEHTAAQTTPPVASEILRVMEKKIGHRPSTPESDSTTSKEKDSNV